MEYQVRRYQVADGAMGPFVEVFWSQIVPLREKFGFVVHSVWAIDDTNEFMWVVGYDGPDGFATANDRYYASPEREQVSPDPLDFLEEVHVSMAHRLEP